MTSSSYNSNGFLSGIWTTSEAPPKAPRVAPGHEAEFALNFDWSEPPTGGNAAAPGGPAGDSPYALSWGQGQGQASQPRHASGLQKLGHSGGASNAAERRSPTFEEELEAGERSWIASVQTASKEQAPPPRAATHKRTGSGTLDGKEDAATTPESRLLEASVKGEVQMVLWHLAAGVPIDTKDKGGRTPLALAIQHKHSVLALVLLTRGAGADHVDRDGNTPLGMALSRNNLALALYFMAGTGRGGWRAIRKGLSKAQATRLHELIASGTHVRVGRAATLIFLTAPDLAIEVLVRASLAVMHEADDVKRKDPMQASDLYVCGWRLELSVGPHSSPARPTLHLSPSHPPRPSLPRWAPSCTTPTCSSRSCPTRRRARRSSSTCCAPRRPRCASRCATTASCCSRCRPCRSVWPCPPSPPCARHAPLSLPRFLPCPARLGPLGPPLTY